MTPLMRLLVVAWYTISCREEGTHWGPGTRAGQSTHSHCSQRGQSLFPGPGGEGAGVEDGCLSSHPMGGTPAGKRAQDT